MSKQASSGRLGIGLIGSGFNAGFHLQAFRAVREADVRGIWSPDPEKASAAAARAREYDVGEAKPYASISEMVADPAIEALWIAGPNHRRVENVEEIVDAIERGRGSLAENERLPGTARFPPSLRHRVVLFSSADVDELSGLHCAFEIGTAPMKMRCRGCWRLLRGSMPC